MEEDPVTAAFRKLTVRAEGTGDFDRIAALFRKSPLAEKPKLLLLGCGFAWHRHPGWETLDMDPTMEPTMCVELGRDRIPRPDGYYDAIVSECLCLRTTKQPPCANITATDSPTGPCHWML